MRKFLVLNAVLLLASISLADTTANVRLQTEIECTVNGQAIEKKHYDIIIPVNIYDTLDGGIWGFGQFSYDYAHPSFTHINVYDTKNLGIGRNYPTKYAMRFSTSVNVYTGASWGEESSLVYFDSFDGFSAISQSGFIFISEDKKDFCDFESILSPAK